MSLILNPTWWLENETVERRGPRQEILTVSAGRHTAILLRHSIKTYFIYITSKLSKRLRTRNGCRALLHLLFAFATLHAHLPTIATSAHRRVLDPSHCQLIKGTRLSTELGISESNALYE